ncbi:hypothetical protein LLG88_12210 [bacterium]|nr:hypothetical protein [bacterium]
MTRPARKEEPKAPPLDAAALKRGLLAGLLAWLVPGLGHFYVGARRRAYAFCGLVVGSALLGVALDGNLAVYDARTPVLSSLQIVGGVAVGPWEPLLRGGLYGGMVYRGDDGRAHSDPANEAPLRERRRRTFREWSTYGSAYLMAAGLMNLLLIFDAWDIGVGRKE